MNILKNMFLAVAAACGSAAVAQNPVVWTKYTADPAPMVKGAPSISAPTAPSAPRPARPLPK